MTINSTFWILQKRDSLRLLQETLERTKELAFTVGSASLDTEVSELKKEWRAIKVKLDYA